MNKPHKRSLCVVFLAIIVLSSMLNAQTNPGSISGRVLDLKTKEPMVGANVILEGTLFGAATDESGRFKILNVPTGKYTLKITYIGYAAKTVKNVTVMPDQSTEITVDLPSEDVQVLPVEISPPSPPPSPKPTYPTAKPPAYEEIPSFPWPPPKASAFFKFQRELLSVVDTPKTLGDVSVTLERALTGAGYSEKSYYRAPEGFALACRLEQILPDGTPASDRWSIKSENTKAFSLVSYLKALFTANPGHYRIVVFIITSLSFNQSDKKVSPDEAKGWLSSGTQSLPKSIASLPFTDEHTCTALIYEFQRVTPDHDPVLEDPSDVDGRTHIEKAGILKGLSK
jgi:hypothetical protein